MKIRIRELRELIRNVLFEDGFSTSIADPTTEPKGFYGYDLERGADIHGFWYRSPARSMGQDGDPGRPEDALTYIGMKPPTSVGDDTGEIQGAENNDDNDVNSIDDTNKDKIF